MIMPASTALQALGLGLLLMLTMTAANREGHCDDIFLGGEYANAVSCYAMAVAAHPDDADAAFNLGVALKAQAEHVGPQVEVFALLRRALTHYERAVALGGEQLVFLLGQAEAYTRLNQLEDAVRIYTAVDRFRRGVPYAATPAASEAVVAAAERAVREDRAASAPVLVFCILSSNSP